MYHCAASNAALIKVTHFVFEKDKKPKKYLENKMTGEKTRPVPITFGQVMKDVT